MIPAGGTVQRLGGQTDEKAQELADEIERQAAGNSGLPRPAQARIIEQAEGICVIEVTCCCGEVLHLQCFVDPSGGSNTLENPITE